jgi:hypothetical protein
MVVRPGREKTLFHDPFRPDELNRRILKASADRERVYASSRDFVIPRPSETALSNTLKEYLTGDTEQINRIRQWDSAEWKGTSIARSSQVIVLYSESPSRLTDEGLASDESIDGLIAELRNTRSLPFAARLADRIKTLIALSEEEYPDQQPLSPPSLRDVIEFIKVPRQFAYPDVVLTFVGNIRIQWRKARNRHFAIEFLGGRAVRWVVFAPDPTIQFRTTRASGLTTLDSVMQLVAPYNVEAWVLRTQGNAG